MSQLLLDLPSREARDREAFIASESNTIALTAIDDWSRWPDRRTALIGPAKSGKTHLGMVWALETGASVIRASELSPHAVPGLAACPALFLDDLEPDRLSRDLEESLLHLLNAMMERKGTLLIASRAAPARWPVKLPDLASRLGTIALVRIDVPDDALIAAMLRKQFKDRQVAVSNKVIEGLVKRMERSASEATRIAETLDLAAMREKRAITMQFASDILGWSSKPSVK